MSSEILKTLGWNKQLDGAFNEYRQQGLEPVRIIAEHKESYIVATQYGDMPAEVTGKFSFAAETPADYPKTGDWAAAMVFRDENKAIIHALLPRSNKFSRKAAGRKAEEQVLAANVDTIFIVQGLDGNYNKMRLLRYAAALKESRINPVAILNKSDINPDAQQLFEETAKLLAPVKVLLCSAKENTGVEAIKEMMEQGRTYAFVGSSGAGKSTLINDIAGETLARTQEVREDDSRGRHTTVTRQLYLIKGHGMIIDTPGMRELALWAEDTASDGGFDIISQYAAGCRYKDCTHENEPGCAVKEAAEKGEIPAEVMASFYKLKKEMEFIASKTDEAAAMKRKQKAKNLGKIIKNMYKIKGRKKRA